MGNRTVAFIRSVAGASLAEGKPFLAVAATRAPHGPQTPAPWYADALPDVNNKRTPAWNYSAAGHVPWVADLPPLSAKEAASYDLDCKPLAAAGLLASWLPLLLHSNQTRLISCLLSLQTAIAGARCCQSTIWSRVLSVRCRRRTSSTTPTCSTLPIT